VILSKLVKEGLITEEHQRKRTLEEIKNGDLYTHYEIYFVAGKKSETKRRPIELNPNS
jgi:hypothetical protein